MNTGQPMYEWKGLPWRKIERQVFKLQKRIYQASRRGDIKTVHKTAFLLHQQKRKCAECGLYFSQNDLLEIDHILPTSQGGRDCYENWQLLHQHCHDKKTEFDKLYAKLGC